MSETILLLVLFSLISLSLLNLALTAKLWQKLQVQSEQQRVELSLPLGDTLPVIDAKYLSSDIAVRCGGMPMVLIFLSSKCADCKEKLPQLEHLIGRSVDAGVNIWLVWNETAASVTPFIGNGQLLSQSISMPLSIQKTINPRSASPFYLFVDENNLLQASGFIGDANWQSFATQISQTETTEEVTS